MRTSEREGGRFVIKSRRRPRVHRMAFGAVVIEIIGHMIGIGDAREACLMTTVAIRGRAGIARRVTVRAGDLLMRADQREAALTVIKGCGRPGRRRVTDRTLMAETATRMIRVKGGRKALLVTRVAGARGIRVSRSMTRLAGCLRVSAGECEGRGSVVKSSRQPGHCCMALGAVVIKITADMIRVTHSRKGALVTGVTVL